MNRFGLSLQASHDLEDIEEYISRDDPSAARHLVLQFLEKCSLLATQPWIGRNRSDLFPGLRGFPVGSYVIFYQVSGESIVIIRVLHGARDLPELFSNR